MSFSTIPSQPLANVPEQITVQINPHVPQPDDDSQPKKKRRPAERRPPVRACDACAIRKVKCEVQRPCKHCVTNKLQCTQLRERKKLGPKNLHKKTLNSINSIGRTRDANHKFDINYPDGHPESAIIASNHLEHPIEFLPDALSGSLSTSDSPTGGNSKRTTNDLNEIIRLVKEPIIQSILEEITVLLLVTSHEQLIEFITENMNGISLDLIINSKDPLYLSRLLVVLSLALLVVENVVNSIHTNMQQDFMKPIDYYQDLKKVLLFKVIEILLVIEKLLLYPLQSANQYQIFYNQSVSSLNISNYFNLTRDHNQLYTDQQKVMFLRKAITHYQMLDHHEISINKSIGLNTVQVVELFEKLFLSERYNYLTSTNLINSTNLFDLNVSFNPDHSTIKMLKLLNQDPIIFHRLKSHNILMNLHQFYKINHYPDSKNLLTRTYMTLKMSMTSLVKNDPFGSIMCQVLLFKALMIYSNNLELSILQVDLIEIVMNLNKVLDFSKDVHAKFCIFHLLPQLLQILKINIDFENNLNYLSDLLVFTTKLMPFFNTIPEPLELIRSNKIIYDWFEELEKLGVSTKRISEQISSAPLSNSPYNSVSYNFNVPDRPVSDPLTTQQASHILAHSGQGHRGLMAPIQQLHTQLHKLEGAPKSTPKDGEYNELLNDFGNSRLSSMSSTSTNSAVVTKSSTPTVKEDAESETPVNEYRPQNDNSGSYSTIIQNPVPAPPVITAHNAINKDSNLNLNISESTKNLYNLFTQMNDDIPSQSHNNSLTNLLQFNSSSNIANFNNLNKISSLSNIRSSNNLKLIGSNSALNLFMNAEDDEEEKSKILKNQFLL